MMKPELTVEQYEAKHGGPVYKSNPDQCCGDRKLAVLKRAIVGKQAWISAIRRDQSPDRARAPIVGWDKKFNLVKINPLANQTKSDIWNYISDNDVPYNPLHDQGYPSIGCWPCTRAVLFGGDERAGRWDGFAKTECGLHSLDPPSEADDATERKDQFRTISHLMQLSAKTQNACLSHDETCATVCQSPTGVTEADCREPKHIFSIPGPDSITAETHGIGARMSAVLVVAID